MAAVMYLFVLDSEQGRKMKIMLLLENCDVSVDHAHVQQARITPGQI